MGLNNLVLSPLLTASLYKTSLIETTDENPQPRLDTIPGSTQWKYLGNNTKNILILVDYKNTVHLPDEQLDFLTNMLSACRLSISDIAIININNHRNVSYKDYIIFFKCNIIFLFGIEPEKFGMPVSFPHYQVQSFSGNTFLFTPSLNEIERDRVQKSKLWVCLRRIFGI